MATIAMSMVCMRFLAVTTAKTEADPLRDDKQEKLLGEFARRHFCGEAHGGFHVGWIADVLPGNVECGAVVDRRADDGNTKGNIDGGFEVDKLHGNVALVVIHGDDQIELAPQASYEDGVGGVRAGDVDAQRAGFGHRRSDELGVLRAKDAVLAGVGVESADADAGWTLPHPPESLVAKLDGANDAVLVEVAGVR